MISLEKCYKLLEDGFSLITVKEDKIPNFSWKKYQTKQASKIEFEKYYNYKGGKTYTNKEGEIVEIQPTKNIGIVTGYGDLECIDVDLKVFSTAKEQKEFWEEYTGYLDDNILDFWDKFVIYKTKNDGYHIIYKTKRVEGNLKIARLKGHKECIIETRGVGGYIFTYDGNNITEKTYKDIQYISDEDREIIMSFSRMYNYVEELPEKPNIKKHKEYTEGDIKPWDDFNEKNTVWDIVNGDFTIVKDLKLKTVVKRHGATSAHSGYIFKDNGCLFLHSTGTVYPNEKQLSPFLCYAYRNHAGDLSSAARQLYFDGYGSRIVNKDIEPKEKIIVSKNDLEFPIEIFPKSIQSYIIECSETLNSSIDYMGCSLLWLISMSIGNSIQIEVKRGWIEKAILWIAVVGKAGIGKTPSISNVIFPMEKINNTEIAKYIKELEKYDFYEGLSKKEKEEYPEIKKPIKSQFIANDITIEALVDLHQQADNAVGVFKDELAGWFKDMNKYKPGSDLEFWLSSWSGKAVNLNRITRPGSFVPHPFIPVLGGIQPSIFNTFYTEENKDNGFIDRMLLSFPDLKVEKYNDTEMDQNTIQWYYDTIVSFYETIRNKVIKKDNEGNITPLIAKFSPEAKKQWIRIFNEITEIQNDDHENEYMKSMLPKQKSYIPRFAVLIHVFNAIGQTNYDYKTVSENSILMSERLSKYFINMAKKVKIQAVEVSDIKSIVKEHDKKTTKEKIQAIYNWNKDFNRSEASEILGVSRMTVIRNVKEIENQ